MKENYSSNSESQVWVSFKEGSDDAFAEIYQKHSSMLYSYGLHITKDKDLVKDCIQSLFVDLWENKENLGEANSVKYYLFKCLKRRIVAELLVHKKFKSVEELTEHYDFEIVYSHEFVLIADQVSKEENESLIRAINKLTKRQKEAIYLLYHNNLSHQEVASIMSIKVTAVYNLVYNALISLKKIMTQLYIILFLLPLI